MAVAMAKMVMRTSQETRRGDRSLFEIVVVFFKKLSVNGSWFSWSRVNIFDCDWKEKCILMYICQVYFVARPFPVCGFNGFSLLCYKDYKKNEIYKVLTMLDQNPPLFVSCWTWTGVFLHLEGSPLKKVNKNVCHCCIVFVKKILILCLVLYESRKQK